MRTPRGATTFTVTSAQLMAVLHGIGAPMMAGATALLRVVRNSHRRHQARRALFALSDAALKDIGLRRPEIGSAADLVAAASARVRNNH